MRRLSVLAVAIAWLVMPKPASADTYIGLHWPKTAAPLHIGVQVGEGVDRSQVSDALAAWSQTLALDAGMVEGVADCTATLPPAGVITVCFNGPAGGSFAVAYPECQYQSPCNETHIVAAKVWLSANDPFLACHEIGHALGLGDLSNPTAPCYTDNGYGCPWPSDYLNLEALYNHDDGYTVPYRAFSAPSANHCPQSPVPVSPFCRQHPSHKKCRP